ncbi:MAG TPA: hypothetical protein VFO44_14985 [Steroidobacteraceae bacterium]|nr:hypothetical protein [Steroidobacteraceae bacterium]
MWASTLLAASLSFAAQPAPPAKGSQAAVTPAPDIEQTRTEIAAIEALLPRIADRGAGLFLLAREYAHAGEAAQALRVLRECMALEAGFDPSDSPALRPLRGEPGFGELSRRAQAQYPPVHRARLVFDVPTADLFPEGLAVDTGNGTFYMGSMHHKKIVSFRLGGLVREFVREGVYDLMPVGGVHVEPTDHSVWASTDAGKKYRPELLHFDSAGRLLERYASPGRMPYDLNDLVLHGDSEIFATDTEGNHVYRFSRRARTFSELQLFRPVLDPNGITISADGRLLFVADILGVIRVDLQKNESEDVAPDAHDSLSGIDGLYWYKGDLVGVQYGTGKFRVARWHLSPDGRRVLGHELLEYRTALVDDPTTGAIYRDSFYFMANTGIVNLDNDEIVDHTKLAPVHIATVSLR